MRLFFKYLKSKKNTIIFECVSIIILVSSFLLYRLPIEVIIYPLVLMILFGLLFLVIDFNRQKKIHDKLEELIKINSNMINSLPSSKTIIEEGYIGLVNHIKNEMYEIQTNDLLNYNNMIDYYTVWAVCDNNPYNWFYGTLKDSYEGSHDRFHVIHVETIHGNYLFTHDYSVGQILTLRGACYTIFLS